MRNYDFVLILIGIFVFRIIVLSGSYADAMCLASLLAYKGLVKYMEIKKISNEVLDQIEKDRELTNAQFKVVAEEVARAKNTAEGLKAAVNFTKR